ncbi:hypothetical protein [Burkholderia sp. SRS-W-2-2016]|uniref:hypothetical protein n=1 Tax=Burkholderia sp. SRS-W-2-2016 TaxID=1926878 RepID=UPI0015BE4AF3|nr:hypothetical protein [Burkholderia sp. SRS-W-2-2016]
MSTTDLNDERMVAIRNEAAVEVRGNALLWSDPESSMVAAKRIVSIQTSQKARDHDPDPVSRGKPRGRPGGPGHHSQPAGSWLPGVLPNGSPAMLARATVRATDENIVKMRDGSARRRLGGSAFAGSLPGGSKAPTQAGE